MELLEAEAEPEHISCNLREETLTRVVKDYLPLVRHAVNRILAGSGRNTLLQYEDMVSCGLEGLLGAHRTF